MSKIKRDAVLQKQFIEDLKYWTETDRKTAYRIILLMEAVLRDPFNGIGKPEQLKYLKKDIWSRRITQEHRIVYKVSKEQINFLQCRYHY
ncbi:MAG TPA: Txe/YoeB family addiction module toxin [Ignavibacteria bacterium]|nr:Txe/YoeB family addiction module toxin [Ignavibacteria bacterium]